MVKTYEQRKEDFEHLLEDAEANPPKVKIKAVKRQFLWFRLHGRTLVLANRATGWLDRTIESILKPIIPLSEFAPKFPSAVHSLVLAGGLQWASNSLSGWLWLFAQVLVWGCICDASLSLGNVFARVPRLVLNLMEASEDACTDYKVVAALVRMVCALLLLVALVSSIFMVHGFASILGKILH